MPFHSQREGVATLRSIGFAYCLCSNRLLCKLWHLQSGKKANEFRLRCKPVTPHRTPLREPSAILDTCAGDSLDPFQQVKLDVGTGEDLLTLEGFSMEQVLLNGTPLLASGGQVGLLQVSSCSDGSQPKPLHVLH